MHKETRIRRHPPHPTLMQMVPVQMRHQHRAHAPRIQTDLTEQTTRLRRAETRVQKHKAVVRRITHPHHRTVPPARAPENRESNPANTPETTNRRRRQTLRSTHPPGAPRQLEQRLSEAAAVGTQPWCRVHAHPPHTITPNTPRDPTHTSRQTKTTKGPTRPCVGTQTIFTHRPTAPRLKPPYASAWSTPRRSAGSDPSSDPAHPASPPPPRTDPPPKGPHQPPPQAPTRD